MKCAAWILAAAGVCACTAERSGQVGARDPPATAAESALAEGQRLYQDGAFDSAAAVFASVRLVPGVQADSAIEARLLTWLGMIARQQGRYRESRALGERALQLKLRLGLEHELFRSYNTLGLLAWNQSRLTEAAEFFARAAAAAEADGDLRGLGAVSNNLALVQTELGDFDEAHAGFVRARELAHRAGHGIGEGNALNNLGMLAIRRGDPAQAVVTLHAARRLYDSLGYEIGIQQALGQLGTAYAALGDLGAAFAALDSALTRSRALGLRQEEATNLEALASLHRAAGDYRRALHLLRAAQEINADLEADVEAGSDLRAEAEILALLGDTGTAQRRGEEALAVHRRVAARPEMLEDLVFLAGLAGAAGRPALARRRLTEARAEASALATPAAQAVLRLAEARDADQRGAPLEVLRALSEPAGGGGGFLQEAHEGVLRARAWSLLARPDSALASARAAVAAVSRVRGTLASGALRGAFDRDWLTVHALLVDLLRRRGRLEEAFLAADAARGRALLERIASVEWRADAAPAVRRLADSEALLHRIGQMTVRLDSMEASVGADRDAARDLDTLRARLGRARADFEALAMRRAADAGTAILGAGTVSVTAIRRVLGPDEVLIEYFVTPERAVAFVVSRPGLVAIDLPEAGHALAARARLARALLDHPDADPTRVLSALHRALLAPLTAAGALEGARRVIIVPHGELASVPFAALRDPGGRYLVEDVAVVMLPTAAALPVLRARAAAGQGRGATAFAPDPARLPGSAGEVAAVRRAIPGTRVAVGRRATERSLREALREGRLVHVAGHGLLSPLNPMFSRIEVRAGGREAEDDGRLEVHEVIDLAIASPLVFLSGCETAVGDESFTALGQAFLHAGAQNVVATLWHIGDRSAGAFAARFYGALSRMPAAEALASAQRSALRDPALAHPRHWAAYVLAGTGDLGLAQSPEVRSVSLGSVAGRAALPVGEVR